jgi:DNA ligase (NAD+)
MFDSERDLIIERIQKEDPTNPYLESVGAPLPDGGNWPKFTHTSVMGSLFKANTQEELKKWCSTRGKEFFLAEKADGWTLAAYYEKGKLKTLATRGDGTVGEDVTPNAKYFKNIKTSLPDSFTGIIRGEGIIHLDDFEKHFAPLNYSNPRNATGKVRDTKNPELKSHIVIKWFDVITNQEFKTWGEKFFFMENLGLETITHYDGLSAAQVWEHYQTYVDKTRKQLNYWIDGLVVRVSDMETHDSLGITDNRPKGSVALKFPSNGIQTQVLDVELSQGRSGRITPVAIFKPVQIDGTTVSRANLHGQDWIAEMGLQIGDIVEVAKAGDIIPQVIAKIRSTPESRPIVFPTHCPTCNMALIKNGAYLECQFSGCGGELSGSIAKWIEKTGIKGIGDSVLTELAKTLKDVSELYTSDATVFAKAAKGSEKLGKKILKEVQKTQNLPLGIFLSALHIDTLGDTNGQRLAAAFKTLDGVMAADLAQIGGIKGIDANAQKIWAGLQEKKDLIEKLRKLLDIEEVSVGLFTGMSFCITGKLSKGRDEVEAWIKQQGGIASGGVSKDLTYLITDDPNGTSSKNQKANQYGVKKITEAQLYELVGGKESSSKPQKRFSIRKAQAASLFDNNTESAGWIEVEELRPNQFSITKTDVTEDPSELGFVLWEGEAFDSERNTKASHIKCQEVEIKRNKIIAPNFESIERVLPLLIFDRVD